MNTTQVFHMWERTRELTFRPVPSPDSTGFAGRVRRLDIVRSQKKHSPFLKRVIEILEANIDDENYDITRLCLDIGISRAQLHRNLKKLTGRSTSKYIRSIRLKKAKELLLGTDLNISQVAFEVGFNDPRYFSRVFSSEFNESPRAFRNSCTG